MSNRVVPHEESFDETATNEDSDIMRQIAKFRSAQAAFGAKVKKVADTITWPNTKKTIVWFLENATIEIPLNVDNIMMAMTFFVLFADDIRIIVAPKHTDVEFQVAYTVCLFSFIIELILSVISKSTYVAMEKTIFNLPWPKWNGYLGSFFFWLDLIAILSMLPDIEFISEGLGLGPISESVKGTNSSFTKAGRVVRTVRLSRLVRLYKLRVEKQKQLKREREELELVKEGLMTMAEIERKRALNQDRSSKVGEELSSTTTKRVIILVLLMLCVIPVLNYTPNDLTNLNATKEMHYFNVNAPTYIIDDAVEQFKYNFEKKGGRWYVLKMSMQPYSDVDLIHLTKSLKKVRQSSLQKEKHHTVKDGIDYITEIWYDNTIQLQRTAAGSIYLTLFVSFVMLTATYVFTNDVKVIVLAPIERMMTMVEEVAKHPLEPFAFSDDGKNEYELKLLETTIEKITMLLRIGFGEAGAGIISENLKMDDHSSGVINPLISGLRVYAIFGFCDIHHFEDVNEKLGKDIMDFVNTIAAIVHGYVHEWRGQSNKNLGQAFLLVWRIGDEVQLTEMLTGTGVETPKEARKKIKQNINLARVPNVDILADSALVAYLKIIAEINRSKEVLAYRQDKRLVGPDGEEFKITMGFGLHAGWAIEGAVGSLQKVDATYLSPHVNMTARLETSSKQYGVPLLFSHNFYELMSPEAQSKCRKLDVITVKGSEVPIAIYTYDCLQNQHFRGRKSKGHTVGGSVPVFMTPDKDMPEVFEKDYDLLTLRRHITPEFLTTFQQGLDQYISGDWANAKGKFEQATFLMSQVENMSGDGPSLTLLRYMAAHNWQVPSTWKGYRPLTSK